MRTFALSTLRAYWEAGHADAEQPLRTWFKATEQADWNSFADVRETFHSVDLVDGNKLVFNIKGNRYRLVCLIEFGNPTCLSFGLERMLSTTSST